MEQKCGTEGWNRRVEQTCETDRSPNSMSTDLKEAHVRWLICGWYTPACSASAARCCSTDTPERATAADGNRIGTWVKVWDNHRVKGHTC